MEVKVLGPGCARCKHLYDEARKAIAQAGIEATLLKIESPDELSAHAVLATPALIIDGKLRAAGRIPEVREIVTWLMTAAQEEASRS